MFTVNPMLGHFNATAEGYSKSSGFTELLGSAL